MNCNVQLEDTSANTIVGSEDRHGTLECVLIEYSLYAILEKVHRVYAAKATTIRRICAHYAIGARKERYYFVLDICAGGVVHILLRVGRSFWHLMTCV